MDIEQFFGTVCFRLGKSVITETISFIGNIIKSIDNGGEVTYNILLHTSILTKVGMKDN